VAAERAGAPFVRWRDGDGELRFSSLGATVARLTIGRGEDADIAFPGDPQVSRTHALLERVGNAWTLVDDGLSRNGSYVNSGRVAGRQRLSDGDRIVVGASEVTYHAASGIRGDETAPAGRGASKVPLTVTQRKILIALCRPVHESESATPATNREIAAELSMSVDAVKAHLRTLFENFGLADLHQNQKRATLVATALVSGALAPHEF